MKKIKDLTGKTFGLLTVIKFHNSDGKGNIKWLCKCTCGNNAIVTRRSLEGKHTKSCGCLKKKTVRKNQKKTILPKFIASGNALYSIYKRAAKRRGYEFDLSKDFFFKTTKQNCHYCNSVPLAKMSRKDYNGSYIYNGIDRINNNIGYIESNCVPCCIICNKAKGTKSYEEFIIWINKLINFYKK